MSDALRAIGDQPLFEYHCNESHDSSDAEIWYRSHQRVTIIAHVEVFDMPQSERFELGHQIIYRVRFQCGLEWDVFEDELLDSEAEYERPEPPCVARVLVARALLRNGHV